MLKQNLNHIYVDKDWVVQQYMELEKNKAWDDIDQIKEKNKEELASEIKMGMESKAALMTKTGEYKN